jgi:hypothetical protein
VYLNSTGGLMDQNNERIPVISMAEDYQYGNVAPDISSKYLVKNSRAVSLLLFAQDSLPISVTT